MRPKRVSGWLQLGLDGCNQGEHRFLLNCIRQLKYDYKKGGVCKPGTTRSNSIGTAFVCFTENKAQGCIKKKWGIYS